ncbi:MAG TPA: hypothetical protein VL068_04630, partial [Microthrixaceae bacterium]|nr:hypothetical protein [Microthrixaceae bacterium]
MTSLLRPLRIVAVLTVLFVAISHGAPVSSQTPDGSPVANDLITTLSNPLVGNSRARNTQTESAKTNDVAKGNSTKAGTPVAPADESERVLTVSSVTPWVDADGEFQVRFSPTGKVPTGAKLTYTIHQSLVGTMRQSLRTKVAEILAGSSSGKVLQAPKTKVLAEYGDPASGAVLSIPVRSSSSSDSTRAFLPNPGIHPVELVLTTADGPEIWSQTVFLNRLPRAATQDRAGKSRNLEPTRPVTVSMLMPIQSDPAFTPEMKTDFSLESRAILDSATNLLKSAKNSPLTIGLRPDTLAGLSATDEAWAQNLVAAIGNATGAEPEPDTIESPNSTDPPPPDKEPSGSGDSGDSGDSGAT